MNKIHILYLFSSQGIADMAFLMDLFRNQLWPLPEGVEFVEHNYEETFWAANPEGAILVVPGGWANSLGQDGIDKIKEIIWKLCWCIILHTSDEESTFNSGQFRSEEVKTWLQMYNPNIPIDSDRKLLYGYFIGTREVLKKIELKPAKDRILTGFIGQVTHQKRLELMTELNTRDSSELCIKANSGFNLGLSQRDYLGLLSEIAIAPSPAGPNSPECFRTYEALETGCLPIVDKRSIRWSPMTNYWDYFDIPFPQIDHWNEIHSLIDFYKNKPVTLQENINKAGAWWINYKREVTQNLISDIQELRAKEFQNNLITVLMSSSPIESHPSTEVIEKSVRQIRAYPELKNAEIILLLDGVRAEQEHRREDYTEYIRRVIELCKWDKDFYGVLPVIFDEYTQQARMVKDSLKLVKTPLVFFCEHDCYPEGEIDFKGMIDSLSEEPDINYIGLSIFESIPEERAHFFTAGNKFVNGINLLRTSSYSGRPHLALTSWYQKVMDSYFDDTCRCYIEFYLEPIFYKGLRDGISTYKDVGMWQYMPDDTNICRSGTSNGRGNEQRYDEIYPKRDD